MSDFDQYQPSPQGQPGSQPLLQGRPGQYGLYDTAAAPTPATDTPVHAPRSPSAVGAAADEPHVAAAASPAARARFIERTYLHLAGAIAAFVVLLSIAVNLPGIERLVLAMVESPASWAVVLVLFIGASWLAEHWARSDRSRGAQYAGLVLYTVAEVITFVPLVYIALAVVGTTPVLMVGAATLAVFSALTAYVFITRKDFSFVRGVLVVLTVGALGLIVASLIFGFHLGLVFSIGMCVLAAGYILYHTSNVLHHYRTDQHVAASLALFSALALLLWYALRILLELVSSD